MSWCAPAIGCSRETISASSRKPFIAERRQGEDQFGLVIGVFVIAFGGAQRDAGGVLFREADLGRRFARVDWIDSG